ncbi:protein-L-isoaspartate O-methyltransferase family protein [Paludibacterium paludis]|uniref:Protein-L-isoaspartate O-methyltransferase n=1 Tax=Paludibacterium paludis TaxID=1225769 RepID=A0A918P126_9NEIS|nr:protein-L-isoaspartate O-methyltransferase [Paludibacterium paludis]GGY12486.1 protein-L-isoaspartate O-methyltransferase [Paludibacterium paludis]
MDFENARFNMVEQQIRPWDVLDPKVLDLLFHVKREEFVSDDQRLIAFVDTELPLPNGTSMLQPKVEARMVQDLALAAEDRVLEVGAGSGYVTALLANLASEVHALECDPAMADTARKHLKKAGIANAVVHVANGLEGLPSKAPFDAIFVGGSLPVAPLALRDQLAVGGRMVVVIGDEPVMRATLIRRDSETAFSETVLFDTCISRLTGFEAIEPERFSF